MPRWLWFLPLGFLAVIFIYNGAKLGLRRAHISETAVIDHYARQYLEDHRRMLGGAAALSDCLGVPGQAEVWIEVRCTPRDAPAFLYGVRRDGALIYAARDGAAPET